MISVASPLARFARFALLGLTVATSFVSFAQAADLPLASGSPLAGIAFDDKPLLLPVQRNFQMAMLTAGGEIGRGCGTIEAYGWRLGADEQERVNLIFNNTVDRMRAQGYSIETKAPKSISQDITMFTADRPDHHLLFMWSAGEIGLVMLVCETAAPIEGRFGQLVDSGLKNAQERKPAPAPYEKYKTGSAAMDSMLASQKTSNPTSLLPAAKKPVAKMPAKSSSSPVGDWKGSYSCAQGTTGGTLTISNIEKGHIFGSFSFYPSVKNPYALKGSYAIAGDYDAVTQRVLITPGKWINRPAGAKASPMVGSFDLVGQTFSGYFQGVTGCTSFEAALIGGPSAVKMEAPSVETKTVVAPKAVKAAPKKAKPVKKAAPAVDPLTSTATPAYEGDISIAIKSSADKKGTPAAPAETSETTTPAPKEVLEAPVEPKTEPLSIGAPPAKE